MKEEIFDEEFKSKLKAFYSFDEGSMTNGDMGYRRTYRTSILAQVLLETAIESGREINLQDHYLDSGATQQTTEYLKRSIQDTVNNYRNIGIEIKVDMSRRSNTLRAYLMGSSFSQKGEYSSLSLYQNKRINPFPIQKLKERKQFLENQLLLLLY